MKDFRLQLVANRDDDGKLRWRSWKEIELERLKQQYRKNPKNFTEIDGQLFHKKCNLKKVHTLYGSALVVAGSDGALALILANGVRASKEFNRHHQNLMNKSFKRGCYEYIGLFSDVIKKNALAVGVEDDGVKWLRLPYHFADGTMQKYWGRKRHLFAVIDKVIYFLATQNILLENMFFKCVELAGGESALAEALSKDQLEKERHLKNFQRLTFKKRANFRLYSKMFSEYLTKHPSLFIEEKIDV